MFLHPRQIRAAMANVAGVGAYRFVVERAEHRDVLRCEVEPVAGADEAALASAVAEQVRSALRFKADVAIVRSLDADEPILVDSRTWD